MKKLKHGICIYKVPFFSRIRDKDNALINLSKAIELDAKYKDKAKDDFKRYSTFKGLWDDEISKGLLHETTRL